MSWSSQRQTIIISYILLLVAIVAAIIYFLFIYRPPSCFDGVRNGIEEGVDCGGGCELVCPFAATKPNIAWARSLRVGPGIYNFAAEVENPNFDVGTSIAYVFRGYNQDNILVSELENTITLLPGEKTVIFEPLVETGNRSVERVFLEFGEHSGWYQAEPRINNIISTGHTFTGTDARPALTVDLENTSTRRVNNIIVTAVIYDENENIVQVSQTLTESVEADSTGQAFFSWREAFSNPPRTVDVFLSHGQ